jgi:hypothetical protein
MPLFLTVSLHMPLLDNAPASKQMLSFCPHVPGPHVLIAKHF